ncbi:hypothetical protein [Lactiplantibacillus carotarum]|uniref:hypothetical protein n=1 Tax=Lactiplantibacillus carotarum TaxID=2993456 RepID=UPI00298F063B|nr:hypothetical protein [Lactiplantibacillus carotarum]
MSESVTGPATYREWVDLLKKFSARENDTEVLDTAKIGTIVWQQVVAERFMQRIVNTINGRIQSASQTFQKQMNHTSGEEVDIIKPLHQLKNEYAKLIQLATIPAIPEDSQQQLLKMIDDNRHSLQQNLETSAKSDRTGKLASLIKNNRVDR